jgi:TonB family protein
MQLRHTVAAGAAALALIPSSPAMAAPRDPTEKWVVNYAEAQCVASRNYGTAEKPLFLVLKPAPIGNVMQLTLVRKGPRTDGMADETTGAIRIDNMRAMPVSILSFGSKRGIVSARMNLTAVQYSAVRSAHQIDIRGQDFDDTLMLSQLEPLGRSLDACIVDLRDAWNATPEAQAKLKRRADASGSMVGIFSSSDYPGIALQKSEEGSVGIVMLIDEKGKIAECVVTETSGVAALDAQVCSIIAQRAKFKPAIGPDLKPAKDSYRQRITWKTG